MKTLLLSALFAITMLTTDESKLPSVMVQSLDGKQVNVNTFNNDGKPFVVNIWATWCSPCKRELNTIHEVYADWQKETGVKLYAISIDDARNKHKVSPYVYGKGWDYEVYIDTNRAFAKAMNVVNPPQTFLFDGNGKLVWQKNGYTDGDEKELFEQIKKYAQ